MLHQLLTYSVLIYTYVHLIIYISDHICSSKNKIKMHTQQIPAKKDPHCLRHISSTPPFSNHTLCLQLWTAWYPPRTGKQELALEAGQYSERIVQHVPGLRSPRALTVLAGGQALKDPPVTCNQQKISEDRAAEFWVCYIRWTMINTTQSQVSRSSH